MDEPPEEVRLVSLTTNIRGIYVRVRKELPDGVDPAYKARRNKRSSLADTFLFRQSGSWHIGPALAPGRHICDSAFTEEKDPTKMPEQTDERWKKHVKRIEVCNPGKEGSDLPQLLEIHSEHPNLHHGVRLQPGDEFIWSADSGKIHLWHCDAKEEWYVTQGPPGTPEADSVYVTVPTGGSRDPRLANWKASGGKIDEVTEVWWTEEKREGYWHDPDFPPNMNSIGMDKEELHDMEADEVEWIMARDMARDPSHMCLFEGIDPSDLRQGSAGDCWLIAAIAAVAEHPEYIEKLFPESKNKLPEDGKHEVWLFDMKKGKWLKIAVDEFIPCKKRQWYELHAHPLFSQPVGAEMWVLLLEKAFAKLLGNYHALEGGRAVMAWQTMTGVQVPMVITKEAPGQWEEYEVDVDEQVKAMKKGEHHELPLQGPDNEETTFADNQLWELILGWQTDGNHVMATSIEGGDEEDLPSGLITGHAYSIINIVEKQEFRLVELRNPWGSGKEWNGKWSDDDQATWDKYPAIAKDLDFHPGDDGTFWIGFEDFVKEFDTVSCCALSSAISSTTTTRQITTRDLNSKPSAKNNAGQMEGIGESRGRESLEMEASFLQREEKGKCCCCVVA